MATPSIKDALKGHIGREVGSFYQLDPSGTKPIAPLGELVSPYDPTKISADIIDSEDYSKRFTVTEHALQDFSSASSNVHKELESITLTGTLVSSIDDGILFADINTLRSDLRRVANLEALADARMPIMYVSPRVSMSRAFIAGITRSWAPGTGDVTTISVELTEARIVSPLIAAAQVADVAASFTGNNAVNGQGTQTGKPVQTQSITQIPTQGVAPFVVPI